MWHGERMWMQARDSKHHETVRRSSIPPRSGSSRDEADADRQARVRFGARVLAPRAAQHDRDATFPIETFRDMHPEGLLAICIPKADGGLGASYRTYCLAAAELGRYCGATALSWNMHVCSTLWTGALADDLDMTVEERAEHNERRSVHYKRIVGDGAIYSQPFSEGGAAAAGARRVRHRGQARRRRLPRQRQEDLRLPLGRRRLLRRAVHRARRGRGRQPPQHALSGASPANAQGVSVVGDWDPLGMRGTVSRTLHLQGCVRAGGRDADAARRLFPRRHLLAAHVPHAVADLHGAGAGGLRFHGRLPARRAARHAAGQAAHVPDQADRGGRDARHAGADQGAVVPGRQRGARRPHARSRCCAPTRPSSR